VSGRTLDVILASVLARLEVLQFEAARQMVLAKADSENKVLGESASRVYGTVTALREDIRALARLDVAAGN
jgi:hypothetical protein